MGLKSDRTYLELEKKSFVGLRGCQPIKILSMDEAICNPGFIFSASKLGQDSPTYSIENGNDATGNSHVVKIITSIGGNRIYSRSGAVLSEYVVVTAAQYRCSQH